MSEKTSKQSSEKEDEVYCDSPIDIASHALSTITTLMDVQEVEGYPDFKADRAKIVISCMHLITLANKSMKADMQTINKKETQ